MLAWEPVVEARALHARGWTISAIARHLQINRRTVRRYLSGEVEVGERRPAGPDPFERFAGYARQRLVDDPHLWASTLHDELLELGYPGSYPSLTRALRARGLRPHCEPCQGVKGRDRAIIDHPAGQETQWDWLELPDPPEHWGWGKTAHLLVGSLAHSSRWRGVLAPGEDQPHLIEALDAVARRLGGLTQRWRFDRMATVCHPDSGAADRHVRSGRGVLPGRGGHLPGAAREPQGGGGEGQPHRRATLVAHPGQRGVPGPGPDRPGPVLRAGRRRPPAAPGGWDRDHGGRAGRRRGAAPDAHRAVPGRPVRRRPDQRAGPGLLPRQLLLRRPGDGRDHGHRGRTGWAPPPSTSSPRAGWCWPGTAANPTRPAR